MLKTFLIVLLIIFLGCQTQNTLSSEDYPEASERVLALSKVYRFKSPVQDAYFDIFDVNLNQSGIPGPTSRDYKIILLVDPGEIPRWTESLLETSFPQDIRWARELLGEQSSLSLAGEKREYRSDSMRLVAYHEQGILLIRILQS